MALTTDWSTLGLPRDLLKAGLCCSGLFDLKAPRLSSRREYVHFDDETEESLSPLRHLDRVNCPLAIGYASHDSPEFQRQSREFADALRQRLGNANTARCLVPSRVVNGLRSIIHGRPLLCLGKWSR